MNKKSKYNELEKALEPLPEHPRWIQWLSERGKYILTAVAAVLVLLFLLSKLTASGNRQAEQDYAQGEQLFRSYVQQDNQEVFAQLQKILEKRPELHAKYDGPLAQILLARNDSALALPYAKSAIERTRSENSPFYSEYAEITLLIAQENHQEALQRSLTLENAMSSQPLSQDKVPNYGPTLYAFNLLRIGALQQTLGLKEELDTWKKWQNLKRESTFSQTMTDINLLIRVGNLSLNEYINNKLAGN